MRKMNARETLSEGESSSARQQAEEGGSINPRRGAPFHERSPDNDETAGPSSTSFAGPASAAAFPAGIHAQRNESRRVHLVPVIIRDGGERLRMTSGGVILGLAASNRRSVALREAEEVIRQRVIPFIPTGGQASAVVTDDSDNGSTDGGDDEVLAKPGPAISGGAKPSMNNSLLQMSCKASCSPPVGQRGEQRYALLTRAIDSNGNPGPWTSEGSMVTRVTSAPIPSVEQQKKPLKRSNKCSVGAVSAEETLTKVMNDSNNFLTSTGDAGLFLRRKLVS